MKELQNIQNLIDTKAENRLKKDLTNMRSTILEMRILSVTESDFPDLQFGNQKTKPYWFFNEGNGIDNFYYALWDYWLPKYKSEEAKTFLSDVERIKSDVNDLMNTNHETDY